MNIRKILEEREELILSPLAQKSSKTRGRLREETECDIRPAFQHDRDRVTHSKSFRRLKHKTQVFLSPAGDHYRTRLTHTLEVSQIARTIARSLSLNEDLVEAIALGHDLGHTPFGHAGEDAILKYFIDRETENEEDLKFKNLFTKEQWNDLTHFEGNANTLRILTKQYNGRQFGGSRLTYSTLGSILKYP